jgi:hypothetical protein
MTQAMTNDELIERGASRIQLWWLTQKHEAMIRDDALDLAKAAITALQSRADDVERLWDRLREHQSPDGTWLGIGKAAFIAALGEGVTDAKGGHNG